MQSIVISVVRSRAYGAQDGFHVYGDHGAGVMEWTRAETPRRVPLREDAPGIAGHQLGGHLASLHLDGFRPDGHLEGTHLLDERGYPGGVVTYETDAMVFGRFRHAVVMEDMAGNAQTQGVLIRETTINSDPPAAMELRPVAHDPIADRLEFVFTPSPRLRG